MIENLILTGECEVGVVVANLETSVARVEGLFGVKARLEIPKLTHMIYRGRETAGAIRLAFFRLGNIQVKLIEPNGEQSVFRDWLDERGEGPQHLAWRVEDLRAASKHMTEAGISLVQEHVFEGGRGCFFDTSRELGMMVELVEEYNRK